MEGDVLLCWAPIGFPSVQAKQAAEGGQEVRRGARELDAVDPAVHGRCLCGTARCTRSGAWAASWGPSACTPPCWPSWQVRAHFACGLLYPCSGVMGAECARRLRLLPGRSAATAAVLGHILPVAKCVMPHLLLYVLSAYDPWYTRLDEA